GPARRGARGARAIPVARRAEGRRRRARRPGARGRASAAAVPARRRARRPGDMARIVVAGAGAIGSSVAYHLALRGARDVVLADRSTVASGATGKAMGGVRQQFSTAPEVRLARDSIRFFERELAGFFDQVGYLFLAT